MSLYNHINKVKFEESQYVDGEGSVWNAKDMYKFVKANKIKKEKLHINSMSHDIRYKNNNNITLVQHIKRIKNTKLKYPIIIHYDGTVVDGYHRIAKAILKKKKRIRGYRVDLHYVPKAE